MRKIVFTVVLVLIVVPCASATDIYVAQSSAGGNTGADCADARAVSSLAAGDWTADNVIHLCGTFTVTAGTSNYISSQGGGTSGHPVTLLFETGANITSPYWSGAAINIVNNYVTVNGGTNGIIQATDNGSALTYQHSGGKCVNSSGASNLIVENITCANIYVRSSMLASFTSCGTADDYGGAFTATNGSNIQFLNNTAHDMHWAVGYSVNAGNSTSNIIMSGNNIYNADHDIYISIGNGSSGTMTGVYMYGNHLHDFSNWDDTYNCDHHDAIHVFSFSGGTQTQIYAYNNLVDGNMGTHANAGIYFEGPDQSGTITSCGIFNNVLKVNNGNTASGAIADYSSNGCLNDNNTIYDALAVEFTTSGGAYLYNNIMGGTGKAIEAGDGGKVTDSNYNDMYSLPATNAFIKPGGACCIDTLAQWQSQTGFDLNSITATPNLSSDYVPISGSPVISAGKNLYSTCNGQSNPGLGALCYDKAGVARPTSAAWDIGAYSYSGSSPSVNIAPASLAFGNVVNGTTSSPQTITLTNTGGASLTMTSVTPTGTDAGRFNITANTCTGSIAASGTCTTTVTFSPNNVASFSANLTYTTNAASSPDNAPLSGTGIAAPASNAGVSPAAGIF